MFDYINILKKVYLRKDIIDKIISKLWIERNICD